MRDAQLKLGFEWSHVTYFPNLMWHSVHQSLTGSPAEGADAKKQI